MEVKHAIAEAIHIFNPDEYHTMNVIKKNQISIVEKRNSDRFYLIKKGEQYDPSTKYSYINYLEKSFNLIHPAVINLSGYSDTKPYLYYKYSQGSYELKIERLSDEKMQIIFIGIAEGLSYLLSNGYTITAFSKNSVIFDLNTYPKLINYINFEELNKENEKELIFKYVDLIKSMIEEKYIKMEKSIDKKSIEEQKKYKDAQFKKLLHDGLFSLFQRVDKKIEIPTFKEFIQFFKENSFHKDREIASWTNFRHYISLFKNSDKIVFDEVLSKYNDSIFDIVTIEQIFTYFLKNREKMQKLDDDSLFLLNFLPEYYVKSIARFILPLHDKLIRFLYNDNISLIIPNWIHLLTFSSYKIYGEIMKKLDYLEKEKKNYFYCDKASDELDYQIEALKIQALKFLEKASIEEKSKEVQIKTELAVQYVKGYLIESDFNKALDVLDSIPETKNVTLANQMKEKIELAKISASIENVLLRNPQIKKEKIEKAKNGDILALLYLGFVFYTGFDDYPIIHSLSFHYYLEAAEKSPYAMLLLGFFYYKGVIFPRNLKKAQECFIKSAQKGCLKAEIACSLLKKHVWRNYLVDFDIDEIFSYFIQSLDLNNIMYFSEINFNVENHLQNNALLKLESKNPKDKLQSNRRSSMTLNLVNVEKFPLRLKPENSEKILLSSEINENTTDENELLNLGKSYFYGDNDFPVNYTKAAKFLKLAADKGNSEAQWRYALLLINNINCNGDKNIGHYLQQSAEKDIRGKFYYAFWVRQYIKDNPNEDTSRFETLIKECCEAGDIESMYYYGMHLEDKNKDKDKDKNKDKNKNKNKEKNKDEDEDKKFTDYYEQAANLGHFDAMNRLLKLSTEDLFEYYLPIGIMNDNLLCRTIEYYDKEKDYKRSNILIQFGIMKNPKLFYYFYSYHLLNGFGMVKDEQKAYKLAISAFENEYNKSYKKRYIYIILQVCVDNNEQKKALNFLLKYKSLISRRFKEHFLSFYKKFDKKLALDYFIPACFYHKKFQACHDLLMQFYKKQKNLLDSFKQLIEYAAKKESCDIQSIIDGTSENPFAMAILGKIYKQEKKLIIRNMDTAVKYFARSAKLKCPLGYYYLGKEYFYGRYLERNTLKAKNYLEKALSEEPRAGYYLFKLTNDRSKLLVGVEYGHNRALLKFGRMLYEENKKEIGIGYIRKACLQKFKKAHRFCLRHGIRFIDVTETDPRTKRDKVRKGHQKIIEKSSNQLEREINNFAVDNKEEEEEEEELNGSKEFYFEASNDSINCSNEDETEDTYHFWT